MQLSPERAAHRLAEVGDAILEARADQLAAELAGNLKAAADHAATTDRALDYWAALAASAVTVTEENA